MATFKQNIVHLQLFVILEFVVKENWAGLISALVKQLATNYIHWGPESHIMLKMWDATSNLNIKVIRNLKRKEYFDIIVLIFCTISKLLMQVSKLIIWLLHTVGGQINWDLFTNKLELNDHFHYYSNIDCN